MSVHHRNWRRSVAIVLGAPIFLSAFLLTVTHPLMAFVAHNRVLGKLAGTDTLPAAEAPVSSRVTSQPDGGGKDQIVSSSPESSARPVTEIGRGTGLVFSPDFSEPRNRAVYEALGFAYFEGTSWTRIFAEIRAFNAANQEHPIRVLILETHGTEGNGLKLQDSTDPAGGRSYVSVGGLQQSLEGTGVRTVVLSACNAGRLFRPEIYSRIDRDTKNRLFLPATEGFVDATDGFDAPRSTVSVVRRSDSNLEALVHANTSELATSVRAALSGSSEIAFETPTRFAVSTMLIQILLQDPRLKFREGGFVAEISNNDLSTYEIEELFRQFLAFLQTETEAAPTPGSLHHRVNNLLASAGGRPGLPEPAPSMERGSE